jgi:hypothetical protein
VDCPPKPVFKLPHIFLAAILCFFATTTSGGQATGSSSVGMPIGHVTRRTEAPPASGEKKLPDCPPPASNKPVLSQNGSAQAADAQTSQDVSGHHKVVLSWNASASSTNADVGYCIYRRKLRNGEEYSANRPLKQHELNELQLLNLKPLTSTSCLDSIVEDDATYEYVARAVNTNGNPSDWSNKVTAAIGPGDRPSATPLPNPLPPPCSGISAAK